MTAAEKLAQQKRKCKRQVAGTGDEAYPHADIASNRSAMFMMFYPAQQDSIATSFSNACAASLIPSTIVK